MVAGVMAIVGRPNVGKSTVFNRLLGQRYAIVDNKPGITRDRLYGRGEWLTKEYRLIDTGGLQLADQPYQKEIKAQVEIALSEADVILMVVNGQEGLTDDDTYIARLLQKAGKPVILAVNKIDDIAFINNIYEFYALGLGEPIAISGVHGIGIGDVLDLMIEKFPEEVIDDFQGMIRFAVIGRPNVGKSSLVNAVLKQERVIVSPESGTTRDAVDTVFTVNDEHYVIVDTAGIRRKGKVFAGVEKYSVLRALSAIERADVVLLVLDGASGIVEQDKHIAGYAADLGKGIIIVYNKWDLVDKEQQSMEDVTRTIRNEFVYLSYAPIIFLSALTKSKVNNLLPLVKEVYNNSQRRIATNVINEVINDAVLFTPPPSHQGKRLKIYYSAQVSIKPTLIVLFVNDPKLLHFSYQRYLENRLREAFDFTGIPLHISGRAREKA